MDQKEILKVAKLARIEVSEVECKALEEKFKQILKHFEELGKLDTEMVEALYHFSPEMPLREDKAEAPLSPELLMRNAPDSFDDSFKIPRVVGEAD
jgi:aspartyl-tRNA(Asn)/glutamyl-tRNA(Gln) amidotransferase subunit C